MRAAVGISSAKAACRRWYGFMAGAPDPESDFLRIAPLNLFLIFMFNMSCRVGLRTKAMEVYGMPGRACRYSMHSIRGSQAE